VHIDNPPDNGDVVAALRRMGLAAAGETVCLEPLAGGVSSDIFVARLAAGPVCVKRALARLKVAAEWRAPTERNRYEAAYLRFASTVAPGAVPEVLAADEESLAFAMPYLDPATHPVWKQLLRDGRTDPEFARRVGQVLARIHAASADRADLAREFATDANFHAIRLEPYLEATARAHPDLAPTLVAVSARTARTRRALVHGDVSPKNILAGPHGPVLLDAECAWFGDPAFDLAFCLNHLLLKAVWRPAHREGYARCFDTLAAAYLSAVCWEPAAELEMRAATLLPGLLLARIDGKSPVEYLRATANREWVRGFSRHWLAAAPGAGGAQRGRLAPLADAWYRGLAQNPPSRED
jgi:aminoglycoside phosphotransferase (APT) family kinase protein